jgi:hypothetical protein
MTSEYRVEFTLSTLDPKGDVDDDTFLFDVIRAIKEVAVVHGCEILWDWSENITAELDES